MTKGKCDDCLQPLEKLSGGKRNVFFSPKGQKSGL